MLRTTIGPPEGAGLRPSAGPGSSSKDGYLSALRTTGGASLAAKRQVNPDRQAALDILAFLQHHYGAAEPYGL